MKTITKTQQAWSEARNDLVYELGKLGYLEEFGNAIAKNLGSPKAICRMSSYLRQVKPKKPEMIVDEMLAIMSEIAAWKQKKETEEANAAYNELLLRGFEE